MRTFLALCFIVIGLDGCHSTHGHRDAGTDLKKPADIAAPLDLSAPPDLCVPCNQDDPHACGDIAALCAATPPSKDGCCVKHLIPGKN